MYNSHFCMFRKMILYTTTLHEMIFNKENKKEIPIIGYIIGFKLHPGSIVITPSKYMSSCRSLVCDWVLLKMCNIGQYYVRILISWGDISAQWLASKTCNRVDRGSNPASDQILDFCGENNEILKRHWTSLIHPHD